ncbi:cellulose synthase catalytic subunit domain protein [Enterobacter roggenkampii]|nr:cellulose synthase catalytic subunit domain protein [Enterobacter roggenkampii]
MQGVLYESSRQLVTHPTGQFAFERTLPAFSPSRCVGI